MTSLSKEEMFNAVKDGVKEAFLTMCEAGDGFTGPVRTEEVMKSIQDGVYNAMYEMIHGATMMPCHDFFDMIKAGTKEAIESINS